MAEEMRCTVSSAQLIRNEGHVAVHQARQLGLRAIKSCTARLREDQGRWNQLKLL
jgi:hypothetical protein